MNKDCGNLIVPLSNKIKQFAGAHPELSPGVVYEIGVDMINYFINNGVMPCGIGQDASMCQLMNDVLVSNENMNSHMRTLLTSLSPSSTGSIGAIMTNQLQKPALNIYDVFVSLYPSSQIEKIVLSPLGADSALVDVNNFVELQFSRPNRPLIYVQCYSAATTYNYFEFFKSNVVRRVCCGLVLTLPQHYKSDFEIDIQGGPSYFIYSISIGFGYYR